MILVLLGIAVLVLGVLCDIAFGAGLFFRLLSRKPDGLERPRYRGR